MPDTIASHIVAAGIAHRKHLDELKAFGQYGAIADWQAAEASRDRVLAFLEASLDEMMLAHRMTAGLSAGR